MLAAVLALGACDAAGANEVAERAGAPGAGACGEVLLPWGAGAGEVGLVPAGPERPARGPMAVAVTPAGDAVVLDQENRRALRVDGAGAVTVVADDLARHAEDLAAGDGLAVYSQLAGVVWLRDDKGAPAGEVAVPRALRGVVGIELAASRQVVARTALQERFALGSPAAPRDLPSVLRGKVEGAVAVRAGGVVTQARAGGVDVVLPDGARHALGAADAAMLVGASGDLVCARVEEVDRTTAVVAVERRAVCVDAVSGALRHDRRLPAPGLYLPRQELALGGRPGAPRLVSIHAGDDGLRVTRCEVRP
jgi:hypothetical protein